MQIRYRTFKKGDEIQLADLFNQCFHLSGFGFCRTPQSILWRYVNRPDSSLEEIQIAEDLHTNKIVGAVYSSIETYYWQGKRQPTGCINDVTVLPTFGKRGIASELLTRAHEYLKSQNCKFSVLSAEAKGYPQLKLYQPMGYQTIHKSKVNFLLTPYLLWKNPFIFPIILYLLLHSFKLKLREFKIKKRLADTGHKICVINPKKNPSLYPKFYQSIKEVFDNAMPQFWDGFRSFSSKEWLYFRGPSYIPSLSPTYVVISLNRKIQGYISFRKQWIYLEKWGFHMPLAICRDWIARPNIPNDSDSRATENIIELLIHSALKEAFRNKCVALLISLPHKSNVHTQILNKLGTLNIQGPSYMYANLFHPKNSKNKISMENPFLLGLGEQFYYP